MATGPDDDDFEPDPELIGYEQRGGSEAGTR